MAPEKVRLLSYNLWLSTTNLMEKIRVFWLLLLDVIFAIATFTLIAGGALAIGWVKTHLVSMGLDPVVAYVFTALEWAIAMYDAIVVARILYVSGEKCVRAFKREARES